MSKIDQKTYLLNKYLKGPSKDKKTKKKRKIKGTGLRVIDDDIDTTHLRILDADELDALELGGEDAPQIAGIIDERPEHVREMEKFAGGSKWRVVAQNDGYDSKLRVEEIKLDAKKVEEENLEIFGKMYSDSEDEKKNDSDLSPPRKGAKKQLSDKNVDSDTSPPRRSKVDVNKPDTNRSSDLKIGREKKRSRWGSSTCDDNLSPTRRNAENKNSDGKNKYDTDSDLSPPMSKADKNERGNQRKNEADSRVSSLRSDKNADLSHPRTIKYKSDRSRMYDQLRGSDMIGREKYASRSDNQRKHENEDSDLSPPRRKVKGDTDNKHNRDSDSDLSPPRRATNDAKEKSKSEYQKRKEERNNDSDLSPPRKNYKETRKEKKSVIHSDLSSPSTSKTDNKIDRRKGDLSKEYDGRSVRNKDRTRCESRWSKKDSPPPSNIKMAKTLEGKMAGLQDAACLREETAEMRRREDELYNKMAPELSGRDAATASRRQGKRETSAEKEKKREKQARQKEIDEKYRKWNKGLKQVRDHEARVEDYIHEAGKPLARSRDDADLERALRAVQREGDPMLEYLGSRKEENAPERPAYKGNWPPNRFNIRPGHRWDGVDRSSGYERRYFEQRSNARAQADEAYKWSTEDL